MGPLIKLFLLNGTTYLILKFVVPNIPGSAPLPASLIFLYLLLTTAGFLILATVSAESKEEFWGPIQRFLTGESIGGLQALRYLVLILFPLLVGWQTYNSTAVSDAPPGENRTIHPAPPGEYAGLSNPVPKTPETIQQGKGFYAAFCSPCHGGNFDGKGSAARGFNPPPANFADPTTIAMLQESFSSGGSRRAASAFRSKGCHGSLRCLAGSLNFPTNGSDRKSTRLNSSHG